MNQVEIPVSVAMINIRFRIRLGRDSGRRSFLTAGAALPEFVVEPIANVTFPLLTRTETNSVVRENLLPSELIYKFSLNFIDSQTVFHIL